MRGRPLTPRQAEVDRLIRAHYALFGEGPSIALLGRKLRLSAHGVRSHLEALVRKGRLVSASAPPTPTDPPSLIPLADLAAGEVEGAGERLVAIPAPPAAGAGRVELDGREARLPLGPREREEAPEGGLSGLGVEPEESDPEPPARDPRLARRRQEGPVAGAERVEEDGARERA